MMLKDDAIGCKREIVHANNRNVADRCDSIVLIRRPVVVVVDVVVGGFR